MAKVKPEWIEAIVQAIVKAYEKGGIQTLRDLEAVIREARDSLMIEDRRLKGATISAMRSNERVRSISRELRQKEAEANRPITVDSLLTDLPLSERIKNALMRNYLFSVGDILHVIHKEGERWRTIRRLRGLGEKSLEEILSALKWAGIGV